MNLPPLKDVLETLSLAELSDRTGFGLRTLYTWFGAAGVPGKGLAREYRIKAIREALDAARTEKAGVTSKKRKAA